MKLNLLLETPAFSGESNTEPVTLAEAKDWLKIDVSDDNNLITELITSARQQCEFYVKMSLITRTVIARVLNDQNNIELPYGPVIAVSQVKDADGNIVDPSNYKIHGVTFKTLDYSPLNSLIIDGLPTTELTVTYTAGYTALPKHFKTAIKNQVAWLYENRGDIQTTTRSGLIYNTNLELSPEAIFKLRPYRRVI